MGWAKPYKTVLMNHEKSWVDATGSDTRQEISNTIADHIRAYHGAKSIAGDVPQDLAKVCNS